LSWLAFWRLQSSLRWSSGWVAKSMPPLILKRAPIGWNQDDFDVVEDGVIVGRILRSSGALPERPWMWASGHNGDYRCAVHGYERDEPTREAAMAAFAKSWRRE
jgi:hypothetical protein